MLNNYIKIALRQFRKQKTFSLINSLGLALSMSICLLIIILIKDAHSFDLFHKDKDRIYRVTTLPIRKDGATEQYASSPYQVGKTLVEEYPQTETWTPLVNNLSGDIIINGRKINFDGLLSDASFFELFNFNLKLGNKTTALNEPYTIVLTNKLAHKLFRNENPIGKEIEVSGYNNPFRITGVLEEFPAKTHLEFEALGSLSTQMAIEKTASSNLITTDWLNYYSNYNYLRLKESANKKETELALANIAKTKYKDSNFESRDMGYEFQLQPLGDITPGPIMSNSMGQGMPIFLVWFLTILGIVIILSACFNYTNLTVARSFIRNKEMGVRKVLGASRFQVFWQIIIEAIVTAFLAFLLSFILLKGMRQLFLQLQFNDFLDADLTVDWRLFLLFLAFTIIVGFIAGLLPAVTLSRINPKRVLQNFNNLKLIGGLGLRKSLLLIQFIVTLIFFITVTISWQQVRYATQQNFGFDKPSTLLVEMQGQDYDKLLTSFSQVSGVESISASSIPMGTWHDAKSDIRINEEDEKFSVREYHIDENYLSHFDLNLMAGENFSKNTAQQKELFAIVNETFIDHFKLGDAAASLGKSIILEDSTRLSIQGVLTDFHYKPSNYAIEPLLLRYNPDQLGFMNVSISTQDKAATYIAIEHAWNKIDEATFEAYYFEDTIKKVYSNVTDILWIISFFGFISMVIAAMGLLGMAIYLVKTKAKEISIRKVMGANVKQLVIILSKSYLWLFAIALVIAIPISYLIGTQILQIFANRISISIFLFLPAILLLFAIVALTIGSQTVKAALANPVNSLRNE